MELEKVFMIIIGTFSTSIIVFVALSIYLKHQRLTKHHLQKKVIIRLIFYLA